MTDLLLSERPAPHVRLLKLNRPDQLNAMNGELCEGLHEELRDIARDRSTRVVVLTGEGRAFCAGLDLRGYGDPPAANRSDLARDAFLVQEHMSSFILALRNLPQPVIAAVNGAAAGFGLSLTLASDIRFAARGAIFRAAFINMGLSNCDMGTSWLLPRLIGASRAHEMMLTGRKVGAAEALQAGLVAEVVDDGAVVDRALQAADQINGWNPWGVQLTKRGMWAALEIPSEQAAIGYEDRQQSMAAHSVGVVEAVTAFFEKRPAQFPD